MILPEGANLASDVAVGESICRQGRGPLRRRGAGPQRLDESWIRELKFVPGRTLSNQLLSLGETLERLGSLVNDPLNLAEGTLANRAGLL